MNVSHFKDYCQLFGVNKNASSEEIKKAYRKLAFEFYPDRNAHQVEYIRELVRNETDREWFVSKTLGRELGLN